MSSDKKRSAAQASLEFIEPGSTLGVGTGSTVNFLIELLPSIKDLLGSIVSSSRATTELLEKHGFTVSTLNEIGGAVDVYIDGADESNKRLQLIKGGGGALTREKIVAAASDKFVCICDESKLVKVLGNFPLPIEVIPMAQSYVARELVKVGDKVLFARYAQAEGNATPVAEMAAAGITVRPV